MGKLQIITLTTMMMVILLITIIDKHYGAQATCQHCAKHFMGINLVMARTCVGSYDHACFTDEKTEAQ